MLRAAQTMAGSRVLSVSRAVTMSLRTRCSVNGGDEDKANDLAASSSMEGKEEVATLSFNEKPQPWEYLPHFSHVREKTLKEVSEEFKRSAAKSQGKIGNRELPNMRPCVAKDMSQPRGLRTDKVNKNPDSPYPIAQLFRDRNERYQTEYGYQRRMYQLQLRLLRRKWLMEHIMQKERKLRLGLLKKEQVQSQQTNIKADPAFLARKKQIRERHEVRMEKRKDAKLLRKKRGADSFVRREAEMKKVRMEAIESLSRLSTNFITNETIESRIDVALCSDETDFDVDVEMPVRKGFDSSAERADQILRRMQGQR